MFIRINMVSVSALYHFNILDIYHKTPKNSNTRKFLVLILKFEQCGSTVVMHPKDADGIAKSVDPDQTASRSSLTGSAFFAQTYLSESLGPLRHASPLKFPLSPANWKSIQ